MLRRYKASLTLNTTALWNLNVSWRLKGLRSSGTKWRVNESTLTLTLADRESHSEQSTVGKYRQRERVFGWMGTEEWRQKDKRERSHTHLSLSPLCPRFTSHLNYFYELDLWRRRRQTEGGVEQWERQQGIKGSCGQNKNRHCSRDHSRPVSVRKPIGFLVPFLKGGSAAVI